MTVWDGGNNNISIIRSDKVVEVWINCDDEERRSRMASDLLHIGYKVRLLEKDTNWWIIFESPYNNIKEL